MEPPPRYCSEGRSDEDGGGGRTAPRACGFDTASRGRRCSVSSMNSSRSLAPPSRLFHPVSNQLGEEDRNIAEVFIVCYCSTLLEGFLLLALEKGVLGLE